jgi:superfamily II DNA or RNA helicase
MFAAFSSYLSGVTAAFRTKVGGGPLFAAVDMASAEARQVALILPTAKAGIVAARDTLVEAEVVAVVSATPVAELADFGARVAPLAAAGFRVVADLRGQGMAALMSRDGIGEVTADAAISAVQAFLDHARAEVRVMPDPDARRPGDAALLLAVVRYETLLREMPARAELVAKRLAALSGAVRLFRDGTSPVEQLFSVAKRTAHADEEARLRREADWILAEARILNRYAQGLAFDPTELWRRYNENAATFVALIEGATAAPASPGRVAVPGLPDQRGGLPAEIADAVEATTLDLTRMTATLRRYQLFGAQYLVHQRRTLLGDDMGLGKTVQVLAAMCHLAAQGKRRFFVVAPNAVLINWEREVQKHTKLGAIVIHGFDRDDELDQWHREGGVAITTFATLGKLLDRLGPVDLVAVDEAHSVKNPEAQRSQAVARLAAAADYVAFLTGTALENRLEELQHLVLTVQPGLRESLGGLLRQARPKPSEVRLKLAPVYLRRTQKDVLKELPDLQEIDEVIPLEPADRVAYAKAPMNLMQKRLAATIGAGGQQAAKYDRLRELLDQYREAGRKVVLFSFFRQVLDDVGLIAGDHDRIDGDLSAEQRQAVIDRFTARTGFGLIVLQIDAGGVGVNLQSAQVVVLMEPQFKPSTERQAVARVRRMGQTRKVIAHRFVAAKTVDEYLVMLIQRKAQLFEDYAQQSAVKAASAMAVDGGGLAAPAAAELQRLIEAEAAVK